MYFINMVSFRLLSLIATVEASVNLIFSLYTRDKCQLFKSRLKRNHNIG